MTISTASIRLAVGIVAAFVLLACGFGYLLVGLRGATLAGEARNLTNWIFWLVLGSVWVGIIGAGVLLRPYHPARAAGLLLAGGLIPLLMGLYYLLISVLRTL